MQKIRLLICLAVVSLVANSAQALTYDEIYQYQTGQGRVLGAGTPAFVQEADSIAFSGNSVSLGLSGIAAHNALAVAVYWNQSPAVSLTSVTDNCSEPQSYTLLNNPTSDDGTGYGAMAYNYNVTGGNCTITANFSGPIGEAKIWAHEISGVATASPLDGNAVTAGNPRNDVCTDCLSSGSIAVTGSDYVFGYTFDSSSVGLNAGAGFIDPNSVNDSRGTTEYKITSGAGPFAATFSRTGSAWASNVVFAMAFKPSAGGGGGGDVGTPSVPTNLSATAVSSSAINLSWTASTDNVGVSGYKIYRGGVQIATSGTNSYSDTGLSASTLYSYTVIAYDAAGNNSSQSSSASATTQAQQQSGNTITATSCSQSAVQTAINQSQTGYTIIVPSGTCTWNTTSASTPAVTINKSVTLQGQTTCSGAGSTLNCTDNTIIKDGTGTGFMEIPLEISASNVRVTGFTFFDTRGVTDSKSAIQTDEGTTGWRIDHNHFHPTNTNNTRAISAWGYGLIDHDLIEQSLDGVDVEGGQPSDVAYSGDTAWASPMGFGTGNAIYIEDNRFNYSAPLDGAYDAYAGAKLVFRYNYVSGTNIGGHGLDSGGLRSTLWMDINNNTFINPSASGIYTMGNTRGGSYLIWNNNILASGGSYNSFWWIQNYRSDSSYSSSWNPCDGTNSIDQNTSSQQGYPCRDQVGRGTEANPSNDWPIKTSGITFSEGLYPAYSWGNLFKSSAPTVAANFNVCGYQDCARAQAYHLIQNRDFYNETASFNGSTGVGRGLLSSRPATCTSGVAYWSTDSNTLYRCASGNTWVAYYTPLAYPYPLDANGLPNPSSDTSSPSPDTTPPSPPTGVMVN